MIVWQPQRQESEAFSGEFARPAERAEWCACLIQFRFLDYQSFPANLRIAPEHALPESVTKNRDSVAVRY
jgi:hypothetical protein